MILRILLALVVLICINGGSFAQNLEQLKKSAQETMSKKITFNYDKAVAKYLKRKNLKLVDDRWDYCTCIKSGPCTAQPDGTVQCECAEVYCYQGPTLPKDK